jgi:hypothetical protein
MALNTNIHILATVIVCTAASWLVLALYSAAVLRLNRVKWLGFRSREELLLATGPRGFIRVLAGITLWLLTNVAVLDLMRRRAIDAAFIDWIASALPPALVAAAIGAAVVRLKVMNALQAGDQPGMPDR